MAPDSDSQKRKRGRPANASKAAADSSASQNRLDVPEEYEADAEEDARPRKRGRPHKGSTSQEGDSPVVEPKKKKKRGRPSLEGAKSASMEGVQGETQAQKQSQRKRGRPSLGKQNGEEPVDESANRSRKKKDATYARPEEPEAEQADEPRKRGRKPAQSEQQTDPKLSQEPPRRKRGRSSLDNDQSQESQSQHAEKQPSKPRKRGRPSLQEVAAEEAHNKATKPSKSKPKSKTQDAEVQEADAENGDEQQGKKRKRGRPSLDSNDAPNVQTHSKRNSEDAEPSRDENPKRRRRRSNEDAPSDHADPPPSPEKPFLHLVPLTKRIRPSTIAAKWSPLSGASVPAAASLLQLAQRPILQRMAPTTQRRNYSQAALRLIMHRIGKKLAKGLPFPPALAASSVATRRGRPSKSLNGLEPDGGREMELDFEGVLDGKAALERQLEPTLHAIELLKREKTRMERELERDYETLRKLENSARAQTRERKDQLKKAHVLAPEGRTSELLDRETIITTGSPGENVFKDITSDPTLHPLALQLAGHVDSIRTNLSQADGIVPRLTQTRAALRDVLARHLDREVYDQVVLGP